MTKLLEQAIAKAQSLPPEDQDALALAMLSLTEGDASAYPVDDATRSAIREGLAEAERGEYVPDDVVAAADKLHGI
jgi:predicted transcriptional regulator